MLREADKIETYFCKNGREKDCLLFDSKYSKPIQIWNSKINQDNVMASFKFAGNGMHSNECREIVGMICKICQIKKYIVELHHFIDI